jgi:biotin carboxyl carrier protein
MNDFIVRVNDSKLNIKILSDSELSIDDKIHEYELLTVCNHSYILKLNNQFFDLTSENSSNNKFTVLISGHRFELGVRTLLQDKAFQLLETTAGSQHHRTEAKAPMPGLILKIKKNIGEKVEMGDSVIVLEAMKMENDIKAPASGIIENINVYEGTAVEKGTLLFSIG